MPVAKHVVEGFQVLCGGARRLFRFGPFIDIPVVLQAIFEGRPAHELPHPFRLRARQGVRLERALDQRNIGQIERQPLGPEDILDHWKELDAAAQAVLQIPSQPAGEQLDERQHSAVQRNVNVVLR